MALHCWFQILIVMFLFFFFNGFFLGYAKSSLANSFTRRDTKTNLIPHSPQHIPHTPPFIFSILAQTTCKRFIQSGIPILADNTLCALFETDKYRFRRLGLHDFESVRSVTQKTERFGRGPEDGMSQTF